MATTNAIFRAVKIINSDAKFSISGNIESSYLEYTTWFCWVSFSI